MLNQSSHEDFSSKMDQLYFVATMSNRVTYIRRYGAHLAPPLAPSLLAPGVSGEGE